MFTFRQKILPELSTDGYNGSPCDRPKINRSLSFIAGASGVFPLSGVKTGGVVVSGIYAVAMMFDYREKR